VTSGWNHSAGSQASGTFAKTSTETAAADLSSAEYQQRVSLLIDHESAVPSCHLPDTLFLKAITSRHFAAVVPQRNSKLQFSLSILKSRILSKFIFFSMQMRRHLKI
jgi:hypothetical protein